MVLNSGELKMEPTFYEELGINMNPEQRKRSLTLEFNGKSKRPKLASTVLSSPDVNKLIMSSPEMEKLLMSANSERTPTPSNFFFPKTVTAEQEMYVQGFEKALNELQNSDSSQGGLATEVSRASSASNYVTLDLDSSYPPSFGFGMSPGESTIIKDEPQTVPNVVGSTPPVSPIDMESQERYKLERKRLRNRVAASKCRKKKLEKIAHLEAKVKVLKGENSELTLVVNRLREEVCRLKEQVISHGRSGCKISYPQHL